ncbi:MAG: hypothetical protein QOE70_3082 [Chthoniobacter sp.]|jgi:hypothetical protein|nr:hypothetical protein [Chthoniobacter sp.]
MKSAVLFALAGLLTLATPGGAVDPRERTDAGQFTIYCEDANLRRQVASFAARTKDEVLALLGESDAWRRPIVVTFDETSGVGTAAIGFRVVDSDVGMKIEIVVHLGIEAQDLNFQRHLIRAVLLEYIYRREGVKGGASYVEPPWWVLDGTVELLRRRETGTDGDFFRKLIETNKLPPIENFLAEKPDQLGPTALAVDRALAMCLLQLLVEQPGGRGYLASLLHAWPENHDDPIAALTKAFPSLSGGAPAIQKWWTLNLARFAVADRFQAMSAVDTDRQIAALLSFEVAQKTGGARRFTIEQFAEYLKLPASRQVIARQQVALAGLSARANGLLRPVVAEYQEVCALLARGKTHGVAARLEQAAQLRTAVVRRAEEIADYLNWFEATQMGSRSHAFDNYLKTANELSEQDRQHRDPVAGYLDELERQY